MKFTVNLEALRVLLLVIISIIPCITCIHRENQTSSEEEASKRVKFRDPRSEIENNITTGEQAWLDQFKQIPVVANKAHAHESRDRALNPSPSLFQKKKSKRERQKQKLSSTKSMDENLVRNEFHPLSEHHALTQTTNIDRSTVARLHNQAHDGSVDSYYFLGLVYLYGLNHNIPNSNKAKDWFEKASKAGHTEGQCALGLILHYGLGDVEQDQKSAMYWFYRAASIQIDSKNKRAYWLLGRSLYEGTTLNDINVDPETATSALGLDIQDYINAGNQAGFLLAAHLFHKAEKIHEAVHHLAIMFEYGLVPEYFPFIQVQGPESIEGHQHGQAIQVLAQYKARNDSSKQMTKFEKAADLYRRAANLGSTESLYNLGLMYTYGRGVPLNYSKAKNLFQEAIVKKHAPSMRYLALLAVNGWGQLEDVANPNEAIYWLDQCIQIGNEQIEELCQSELEEVEGYVNAAESFRTSTLQSLV